MRYLSVLIPIAFALALAAPASGQCPISSEWPACTVKHTDGLDAGEVRDAHQAYTFGNLPACSGSTPGKTYYVTDAPDSGTCSTGGSTWAECACDGTSYIPMSGGGSGGGTHPVNLATDVTGTLDGSNVEAASNTQAGTLETATTTEVNTGSDTGRAVSPYSLANANLGGELGGPFSNPAVDATHAGSAHHTEAHAPESHTGQDATAAELEELTDASETTLHSHAGGGGTHPVNLDTDVTGTLDGSNVEAASETQAGVLETATITEVDTGTDAGRAVSPDSLEGAALTGELGGTFGNATVDGTHAGSAHHAEAHAPESHTGQGATAAELEELTDASETTLHSHAGGGGTHPVNLDTDVTGTLALSNIDPGFAVLAGTAGGQTLTGGTAAGEDLGFSTTSNGTKGSYIFQEDVTGTLLSCIAHTDKLGIGGGGNLVCDSIPVATTSVNGLIEAATITEVDTGTDAGRAVSPDSLEGAALTGELGGTFGNATVDGTHAGSAHHAEAHAPESHTGQGATAAELEELTDASETTLHSHAGGGGDPLAIELEGAEIDGAVTVIDFATADFDITEPTDHEPLVVIAAAIARIASPNLTGNPTAPNQLAGDNDASIANTEYADTAVFDHDAIADAHHTEAHAPESHTGQGATAAELEELTDASETTLHSHAGGGGTHPVNLATDVTGTLDGSNVEAASETQAGVLETATITEVDTGTDTGRAVSPDSLEGAALTGELGGTFGAATVDGTHAGSAHHADESAASEGTAGILEIATQTEVDDGTDNTRAVSPAGLNLADISTTDLNIGGRLSILPTGGIDALPDTTATPDISGAAIWETVSGMTTLTDFDQTPSPAEGDTVIIVAKHTYSYDCQRGGSAFFFCGSQFLGTFWQKNGDVTIWIHNGISWGLASDRPALEVASATLRDPTVDDDILLLKVPTNFVGLISFTCITSGGVSSPSLSVTLMDCDTSAGSCATTGGEHTISSNYTNYSDDSGDFSDATNTLGRFWVLDIVSVTTPPDLLQCQAVYVTY